MLTPFDKWWFQYCAQNGYRAPKKMHAAALAAWHAAASQNVPAVVGAALIGAHVHTAELREAWRRGVMDERDGGGARRSNRNMEVEVALRQAVELMCPGYRPGGDRSEG